MPLVHQRNRKDNPWHSSALYEVWRDMMRKGRRLYNRGLSDGAGDGFPVDPIFREFEKFRLWACFCCGYRMGDSDGLMLARRNVNEGFSPENCYMTLHPPIVPDESLPTITKGASGCVWKDESGRGKKGKWGGLSATRLYCIWKGMIRRCIDPGQKDYPAYGGRGIKVCEEWRRDFLTFTDWAWDHGYSTDLSLDRIDVDGDYCPHNCRWAGGTEQKLNTREYNGRYTNLRLRVDDMRRVLSEMRGNIVVTMIIRTEYLPNCVPQEQADYPPVPVDERIDKVAKYRRNRDGEM